MIELFINVESKELMEKLSQRGYRRLFKHAFIEGADYWHREILPFHFQAGNSLLYPGAFTEKKSGGIPLVDTGEFRDRILSQRKIRATFKGATISYLFGRPEKTRLKLSLFNSEYERPIGSMKLEVKKHIFGFMRGKHMTFEEARKQIKEKQFKKSDYGTFIKVRMAKGVRVFNAVDRERIKKRMQQFINENVDTLGKANYRFPKGEAF